MGFGSRVFISWRWQMNQSIQIRVFWPTGVCLSSGLHASLRALGWILLNPLGFFLGLFKPSWKLRIYSVYVVAGWKVTHFLKMGNHEQYVFKWFNVIYRIICIFFSIVMLLLFGGGKSYETLTKPTETKTGWCWFGQGNNSAPNKKSVVQKYPVCFTGTVLVANMAIDNRTIETGSCLWANSQILHRVG